MWLRVSCRLEMAFDVPSPMILLLRPRSDSRQWVARDYYAVWPPLPIHEYTDIYGNRCQRLLSPAGRFQLEVSSDVHVAPGIERRPGAPFVEVQELPVDVLTCLAPSRYCESDRLGGLATRIAGRRRPGYEQVQAITEWIHRTLEYRTNSHPVPISAEEVLERGHGVCRDFAHVGIALCRSLSIPARITVGYLHRLEPMDLHAWFEAFLDGEWYVFDPTRATLSGGRVCLAHGRDAADVPVFTQFGPPVFPTRMDVTVDEVPGP
ncbi:transglutaminase domain-containing protein [Thioalkalivibrio sp.]|uniref:transglutaminase domain-containing protein n=1 Tax=Thioalkalivibrio sp. TaxID=2093813 RepID=UPI0035676221